MLFTSYWNRERLVSAVCCIFALDVSLFMCALELFVGVLKEVRATVGDLYAVFAICVERAAGYHVIMRCCMRCWRCMRYCIYTVSWRCIICCLEKHFSSVGVEWCVDEVYRDMSIWAMMACQLQQLGIYVWLRNCYSELYYIYRRALPDVLYIVSTMRYEGELLMLFAISKAER